VFRVPVRNFGGTLANYAGAWNRVAKRSRTMSEAFTDQRIAYPVGYLHPYAVDMPLKPGGISTFNQALGTGALAASGVGGKNAESALSGSGSLDVTGRLVVAAIAALTGTGSITGTANATLAAVAALSGAGTLTAGIGAIGGVSAVLTGSGTLTAASYATGTLAADLPGEEGALTTTAIATAVWAVLATDHNDTGSMGEKMNDAGSAGDPWSTTVPGAYAEGTAGALMGKLLTTAKFIGLSR